MSRYIDLEPLIERLKELEAEDVAPVVHSRWVRKNEAFSEAECENCGCQVVYQMHPDDDGFIRWEYENYCPHCGAKMDRGANK